MYILCFLKLITVSIVVGTSYRQYIRWKSLFVCIFQFGPFDPIKNVSKKNHQSDERTMFRMKACFILINKYEYSLKACYCYQFSTYRRSLKDKKNRGKAEKKSYNHQHGTSTSIKKVQHDRRKCDINA